MRKKLKHLEINLAIYRCHDIIFWETTVDEIAVWGKKNKLTISEKWIEDFKETVKGASGACLSFGYDNRDRVIWLKERPHKATQYGVLYHELYHAVDFIADEANLDTTKNGTEARAYIFEYLAKKSWN